MRDFFRKYRGIIIIVGLLTLPFIFLYRDQGSASGLVGGVQWLTGPIQSGCSGAWDKVSGVFARYLWLVDAAEENQSLREQVDSLKQQVQQQNEHIRENQRLVRMLDLQRALPQTRLVAARVIAFGQSPSYRTMRINRGTTDGIERRAGVISPDGVVGRVIAVSSHYADVLLIVDGGSRLDIVSASTRARGVLRGGGSGAPCLIDAMDRTFKLESGDDLLTSGLDGIFPKGIPVGSVTKVTHPTMGLYLDAQVKPFVSFSRVEEVFVVVQAPADLSWPGLSSGPSTQPADAGVSDDAAAVPKVAKKRPIKTKPAAAPVSAPAAKPAAKPAVKPAATPVAKPAATPAAKPAAKPAATPAAKPAAKPAEKPAAKPAAKPVGAPKKPAKPDAGKPKSAE